MNIGIENLKFNKYENVSLEQFEESIEDIMDNTDDSSYIVAFERYEKLLSIYNSIASCKNVKGAVELLKTDPNVIYQFGSVNPMKGIARELKTSEEVLFASALIASIVIDIIYAAQLNLRRIKTACLFGVNGKIDPEKIKKKSCRRLCPKEVFMRGMAALKKLGEGIYEVVKNPNANIENIIDGLRALGVNIKANGKVKSVMDSEWRPTYFGRASNKGSLEYRGWDENSIKEAAKAVVDIIDFIMVIKNAKSTKLKEGTSDAAMKKKFVAKATKLYIHTIQEHGRALALAINKVKTKDTKGK